MLKLNLKTRLWTCGGLGFFILVVMFFLSFNFSYAFVFGLLAFIFSFVYLHPKYQEYSSKREAEESQRRRELKSIEDRAEHEAYGWHKGEMKARRQEEARSFAKYGWANGRTGIESNGLADHLLKELPKTNKKNRFF